jgi:hypothetical protein
VELVGHAQERMDDRDVTDEEILLTLREPHETGLPTQPGRQRVRRRLSARWDLHVVYEELGDRLRVITVMPKARRLPRRRGRNG